jgi:hypothetical protein
MRAARSVLALITGVVTLSSVLGAQDFAPSAVAFDLPAGQLGPALKAFNAQSGVQVLVSAELAADVSVRGVRGTMLPRTALERMLEGTNLGVSGDPSSRAYAIVRRSAATGSRAVRNAAALIVVGLCADEEQARRLWEAADGIRYGLQKRGIPASAITVIPQERSGKARRDAFLAAARGFKPSVDESWLILLGEAAPGRDDQPAFQVSGPRISTSDLVHGIEAMPGHKYVVLAMANSGGFLPTLVPLAQVEAVAATAEAGERNEPRFATMWAGALADVPDSDFQTLAATAATRVADYYAEHALGQGEHAQLIERPTGHIVSAPFFNAPAQAAAP